MSRTFDAHSVTWHVTAQLAAELTDDAITATISDQALHPSSLMLSAPKTYK